MVAVADHVVAAKKADEEVAVNLLMTVIEGLKGADAAKTVMPITTLKVNVKVTLQKAAQKDALVQKMTLAEEAKILKVVVHEPKM